MVVVDFRLDARHGPPPEHRIAPDEVERQLTAAGLSARVLDTGLKEQYVVTGSLR